MVQHHRTGSSGFLITSFPLTEEIDRSADDKSNVVFLIPGEPRLLFDFSI